MGKVISISNFKQGTTARVGGSYSFSSNTKAMVKCFATINLQVLKDKVLADHENPAQFLTTVFDLALSDMIGKQQVGLAPVPMKFISLYNDMEQKLITKKTKKRKVTTPSREYMRQYVYSATSLYNYLKATLGDQRALDIFMLAYIKVRDLSVDNDGNRISDLKN